LFETLKVQFFILTEMSDRDLLMSSAYGHLQGQAIDKLDEARTNVDDQIMLVRQASHDRVMCWRKS